MPFTPLSKRALALALAAGTLIAAAPAAASDLPPLAKPAHAKLAPGDSRNAITVKFAEGSDVRLRGNQLVSQSAGSVAGLDKVLGRFPGLQLGRVFASASESELAASRREARQRSGREHADLNLYYRIETGPGTDVVALLDALNALDVVEIAAPEPKPVAPPATPSFVGRQGYRTAASTGGVDADYAQTLVGGRGERATIVDIEYSWNRSHEDLSKARLAGFAIPHGTACAYNYTNDHGTAVLGELGGDANAYGVTGLAPGATLRAVNVAARTSTGACGYYIASAITTAANNTVAGDVILIEQQIAGPNWREGSDVGLVPVEWDQSGAVRAAIQNATARGRIVVEAAGNGYQNLDAAVYGNWFATDSGAIMVGAGDAPGCASTIARQRLAFSNYGSRLNVQGWGNCVTTTGYGGLWGTAGSNAAYTAGFSGTSSASPIVAASAAMLSSVAEARGTTLTPATVRSKLASTGQAQQFGAAGRIGPLPNLRAAIASLGGGTTTGPAIAEDRHTIYGSTIGATTVSVRQSWSIQSGTPATYEVWLSTDGGPYVKKALASPSANAATFSLERNHDYQFAARAANASGSWGEWAYGKKFNLGEYQENYTATNPAFTGTWTHSAWAPASSGFVRVSQTAGDRARFSFTGTNVAWIASKSTNRGAAAVYVDGALVKTVDLYSATTVARAVAFNYAWSQSGTHTIEVRVLGTSGRPKVDVDAFVRLR